MSTESFSGIAFELTAIKKTTQHPNPTQPTQDYTLQVLHFPETELKIVFRSAVAEINRRSATDVNWQIHMVDRIVSTVLGQKKKKRCIESILHTACSKNTFKYISFCALHYSITKSNSG